MGLAKMTDAPVLLVGDINRGGIFAQLVGTMVLLDDDGRDRVKGLIINKFRGDMELFRPGLAMLEEKAGKPVIGTIPYLDIDIEDEDDLKEEPAEGSAHACGKVNGFTAGSADYKEEQYNKLAEAMRRNLDMGFIYRMLV
jgi:cobyric acid synthase